MAKGEKNWVSLSVNTDDETIEFVDGFADLPADQWPSKLPDDKPLYVFIKTGDSLAMVYYCPDTAPIKQKMLGSTVKASAQAQAAACEPASRTASDRLSLTVRPTSHNGSRWCGNSGGKSNEKRGDHTGRRVDAGSVGQRGICRTRAARGGSRGRKSNQNSAQGWPQAAATQEKVVALNAHSRKSQQVHVLSLRLDAAL